MSIEKMDRGKVSPAPEASSSNLRRQIAIEESRDVSADLIQEIQNSEAKEVTPQATPQRSGKPKAIPSELHEHTSVALSNMIHVTKRSSPTSSVPSRRVTSTAPPPLQ